MLDSCCIGRKGFHAMDTVREGDTLSLDTTEWTLDNDSPLLSANTFLSEYMFSALLLNCNYTTPQTPTFKATQHPTLFHSGSMYFLYKELQRAVGAKLCCKAYFCNDSEESIITCSSDTMVVYRVVRTATDSGEETGATKNEYHLRVVCEFPFAGEILSIAPIPLKQVSPYSATGRRDALIMSFKGFYVSVVAFDTQSEELYNIECYDFHKEAVVTIDSRSEGNCER